MNNFDGDLKIPRRKLIQIGSAALFLQNAPVAQSETCSSGDHAATAEPQQYKVQFFTSEEISLLDTVMEKIIPADKHSPGAHEAQVSFFADLMIATSPSPVQEDWRRGLQLLSREIEKTSLDEWLAKAAINERNPITVLDLFFVRLKQMTVDGYYTSAIGIHNDLDYQGNTYVKEFKGCSHEEHKG